MILKFKLAEEFLKFAELCNTNRFQLYFIAKESQFMLRPSKSSKNLDTAVYEGNTRNKEFREALFKLFPEETVISVAEISFMKE